MKRTLNRKGRVCHLSDSSTFSCCLLFYLAYPWCDLVVSQSMHKHFLWRNLRLHILMYCPQCLWLVSFTDHGLSLDSLKVSTFLQPKLSIVDFGLLESPMFITAMAMIFFIPAMAMIVFNKYLKIIPKTTAITKMQHHVCLLKFLIRYRRFRHIAWFSSIFMFDTLIKFWFIFSNIKICLWRK